MAILTYICFELLQAMIYDISTASNNVPPQSKIEILSCDKVPGLAIKPKIIASFKKMLQYLLQHNFYSEVHLSRLRKLIHMIFFT